MFFGQKLKEIRLNRAKMGLHKFAEKIDMDVIEYLNIEKGYAPRPDCGRFMSKIRLEAGLNYEDDDWDELVQLSYKPFVMQKMSEGVVPSPFTHKSDGTQLTKEEFISLTDHINNIAKEHNKKAEIYNNEQQKKN